MKSGVKNVVRREMFKLTKKIYFAKFLTKTAKIYIITAMNLNFDYTFQDLNFIADGVYIQQVLLPPPRLLRAENRQNLSRNYFSMIEKKIGLKKNKEVLEYGTLFLKQSKEVLLWFKQ